AWKVLTALRKVRLVRTLRIVACLATRTRFLADLIIGMNHDYTAFSSGCKGLEASSQHRVDNACGLWYACQQVSQKNKNLKNKWKIPNSRLLIALRRLTTS